MGSKAASLPSVTIALTFLSLPLLCARPAMAARAGVANPADTAWVLMSAALVLLMLPGLALFYGGMVRRKNVLSSLMHSFVALGILGLLWVVIGYSLAFTDGNWFIGGLSQFMLCGTTVNSVRGSIPTYAFVMFQGMFAIITPALISGAVAERMTFKSYLAFLVLWSLLVYYPLAHWVWGGGWFQAAGGLDFAGGLVVHLSAGVSALAIAYIIGKRTGFPHEMFVPHNLTMTLLGVGLLWFGWFGFNAGSALAANSTAALAFTATMVAASAGACSWMLLEWMVVKQPSALGFASGIVAGLGAVTPASGFVTPGYAIIIGIVSGAICFFGVRMKFKFSYDDALDVVGVHGVGGLWGTLATGLFATVGATGLIAGNPGQFEIQLAGVIAVGLYCLIATYAIGQFLEKTIGLRVSVDQEHSGLDEELHGEVGYSL
ncbi:MAG: ammonium transporter [Syntrophobacteraceae bacterium]|nr:ammonium transporter [Syntrophobacteraceae bacterium]